MIWRNLSTWRSTFSKSNFERMDRIVSMLSHENEDPDWTLSQNLELFTYIYLVKHFFFEIKLSKSYFVSDLINFF